MCGLRIILASGVAIWARVENLLAGLRIEPVTDAGSEGWDEFRQQLFTRTEDRTRTNPIVETHLMTEKNDAPPPGLEPGTYRLTAERSAN